jgi:hypothetical protein
MSETNKRLSKLRLNFKKRKAEEEAKIIEAAS